eukprot:c28422_g1_i2 orf=638-841(-)
MFGWSTFALQSHSHSFQAAEIGNQAFTHLEFQCMKATNIKASYRFFPGDSAYFSYSDSLFTDFSRKL